MVLAFWGVVDVAAVGEESCVAGLLPLSIPGEFNCATSLWGDRVVHEVNAGEKLLLLLIGKFY